MERLHNSKRSDLKNRELPPPEMDGSRRSWSHVDGQHWVALAPAELRWDSQNSADDAIGWMHGGASFASRDAHDSQLDLGALADAPLEIGRADVAIRTISQAMGFINQSHRTPFVL